MNDQGRRSGTTRRQFLATTGGVSLATAVATGSLGSTPASVNLAPFAKVSASFSTTRRKVRAVNSGYEPSSSRDRKREAYDAWPHVGADWLEYEWPEEIATDRVEIYWLADGWDIALPSDFELQFWDGREFVAVRNLQASAIEANRFNVARFAAERTRKLRLRFSGNGKKSAGVIQWRVWSAGDVPALAPVAEAGVDRVVMVGSPTYLMGAAFSLGGAANKVRWRKVSGPGTVKFADPGAVATTATVSAPGDYVLELRARDRGQETTSTLRMRAETPPPVQRLDVVYTTPYAITSPLWQARAKALIVNWIPHCIANCERTDLPNGRGGLDNFIEAAKALRDEPHAAHQGYVFSNAWVHQTVESMCIALMVDAAGDAEIEQAHEHMRATLAQWIPIILAAQHPDGYLQTAYTLADRAKWPERWSPSHRGDHEGYVSGYFIESAINHHTLTAGKDLRLYDAAKRLADCWVANIGPGKKVWYDGHQEMEQALVRFGRFVNDVEGGGRGDTYIALARFLLESRDGGGSYDQAHLPPRQHYEALGHAVRAMYFYSGMADIAAETGDRDYQSAVASLHDNLVNRKYYVTGGIGSGDTPEGFGDDYGLRNDGYCESCSSCGLVFFQYKLNLAYGDARYADAYEETMYNALLGAVDLPGKNFTYENPLVGGERARWHTCPCCVGNIPRTLLMIPTWAYSRSADSLYVNLFVGSRIQVGKVAGTPLEVIQETNYPWSGALAITINPQETREFSVRVRVPDRKTSALYTPTPEVNGYLSARVNGEPHRPRIEHGYAVFTRTWKRGDRIELTLPHDVQRVIADNRIEATRGKVALRYGPMVYNVELADQARIDQPIDRAPLAAEWRADLLGGVTVIKGRWRDGSALTAIPNFARLNREGTSQEFPSGKASAGRTLIWIA
ncbi:MAG TPA: beta-L-arabinofuranosidase domain-containing protein, partial [Steroidobacteraceae bacterium]|nr:beta-L-arabinofuranosidase domain-containing protein [Steroidobacteraceae bacterium]